MGYVLSMVVGDFAPIDRIGDSVLWLLGITNGG